MVNGKSIRVIFFGSGDFVEPVIETLKKNFTLIQVVTPQVELSEKADLGVVASYGRIVSKETIESFPHGIINIHPSLLPKYRGPTPVQTAILNGDEKTGVTIIKLDEKVDHGPILAQEEIEISGNETSKSLLKKTFDIGAEMLPEVISNYIKGGIKATVQDDSKATFTEILTKEKGYIDINNPPGNEVIGRMIRAFYPWPGVWLKTNLSGKEQIIKLLPEEKIHVEGKKPMNYKDFVNGYNEGKEILRKLNLLVNN